jgi:Na+/H+ antiporter NhaC
VGSGLYFTFAGIENAFYQLSPTVAIIPAIALGWALYKGPTSERMQAFLDGVRHRDIITMCIVFLLAGAFSMVTKSIGSVDSTVNLILSIMPSEFLLIGIFLTAAFISTAIGTSMGTIATVAPITAGLIDQGAFPAAIGMATVVGGAMFGDNLSIISDTTIAAVMSQGADMKLKLKLNSFIAVIASLLTIVVLFFIQSNTVTLEAREYSLLLVTPYLFLTLLAVVGVNVFIVLISALSFAGIIGYIATNYSVIALSKDIAQGFTSMQEIMLLSLMVGGLSGLIGKGSQQLAEHLTNWIGKHGNQKMAQLVIAKIVSVFDILLANNTVAITFSGAMAKDIANKYRIPSHYSAAWLDIFSCVWQGLIPYGAQILMASTIAGISPLSISPYVYYCYILAGVTIIFILFNKRIEHENNI